MPSYTTVEALLKKICGKFTNKGLDMDDLMQEARLIVWKSENKYDKSLGVAWTTYAGRVAYNELRRKLYWPSGERRYSTPQEFNKELSGGMCPQAVAEVAEIIGKISKFRNAREGQRSKVYLIDSQDKAINYVLTDQTIPKNLGLAKQMGMKKLEAYLRKEIGEEVTIDL